MSATPERVNEGVAPPRRPAVGPPPATGPSSPQRSSDQIRSEVEARRLELAGSVELFRHRVGELTDWRRQVREHRNELIAGAAIAGFVVGGLLALRRRRR